MSTRLPKGTVEGSCFAPVPHTAPHLIASVQAICSEKSTVRAETSAISAWEPFTGVRAE